MFPEPLFISTSCAFITQTGKQCRASGGLFALGWSRLCPTQQLRTLSKATSLGACPPEPRLGVLIS